MKVIGISGLDTAVSFKKARWPGLEEREYRLAQGMDAAAALVIDGRLVAAAEQERFSGMKQTGSFPIDAIRYCLNDSGISIEEIDEIAHGFDYEPFRDLYLHDEASAGLYQDVFSRDALLTLKNACFQSATTLPTLPVRPSLQAGMSRWLWSTTRWASWKA
jgi:carbamoyltransferase